MTTQAHGTDGAGLPDGAGAGLSWRDWRIPLSARDLTLQQALQSLSRVGAKPQEVPLIVRLLENPEYHLPGWTLFHGAVDLYRHDAIHALLGRGLLKRDEAFVIGFTMGSTREVGSLERRVFSWIAAHWYPWVYRFRAEDCWVFHGAVQLAARSGCARLDRFDFRAREQDTLGALRAELGISEALLQQFYLSEAAQFPGSLESERLAAGT